MIALWYIIVAISGASTAPTSCLPRVNACGDFQEMHLCEQHAQEVGRHYQQCVWGHNVYGSTECRADFRGSRRVRPCPLDAPRPMNVL